MSNNIRVFLLLSGLCFAHASLFGQDAREIILKYLDTVSNGNTGSWRKVKTLYRESIGYYNQDHFDQKPSLNSSRSGFNQTYRVYPRHAKHVLYEDSSFTRPLISSYHTKDKSVIILPNLPPKINEPAEPDEMFADLLPMLIEELLDKSSSVRTLGTKQFLEGVTCYEISMQVRGRTYMLYINTSTYLLEYWNNRKDEDLSILTGFGDYKWVDGLLMPMREFMSRNGVVFFSSTTNKLEINRHIPMTTFDYPAR